MCNQSLPLKDVNGMSIFYINENNELSMSPITAANPITSLPSANKRTYQFYMRFARVIISPQRNSNIVYIDYNSRFAIHVNDTEAKQVLYNNVSLPFYPYDMSQHGHINDYCSQVSASFTQSIPLDSQSIREQIDENTRCKNANTSLQPSRSESTVTRVLRGETVDLPENSLCLKGNRLYKIMQVTEKEKVDDEPILVKHDNYIPLANFCVIPIKIEHHHNNMESYARVHTVILSPILLQPINHVFFNSDIEQIGRIIPKTYPGLYVNPDFKRAEKYITASVSMQFHDISEEHIFHYTGWHPIPISNGKANYIYLNDNLGNDGNIKCQSGKSLLFSPYIARSDAFFYTMRMLLLSEDMSKTLPLLLFSHLGVMFSLFEKAGFAPRFVLFLRGITGSLKTSLSKVMFKILKDNQNDIPANFNDTITALEVKMNNTRDEVLLVDDFRPSAMKSEVARMRSNLEKIIRFYGDGIGKGRSNVQLGLRNEARPYGICAVTGEYIHGTASSLQRMLIINIDRNTINPELLKFYQDNPMYYLTHMRFFIDFIENNYEEIVGKIAKSFCSMREQTSNIKSKRLIDTKVCLELTAEILMDYAQKYWLIYPNDRAHQLEEWKRAIADAIKDSEALSRYVEPADMYCHAMLELIRSQKLNIANTKNEYIENRDKFHGFYDIKKKHLFVIPISTYTEVRRFWDEHGMSFTYSDTMVRQELSIKKLIFTQVEGETEKTARSVHVGDTKQQRMLHFNAEQLLILYGEPNEGLPFGNLDWNKLMNTNKKNY